MNPLLSLVKVMLTILSIPVLVIFMPPRQRWGVKPVPRWLNRWTNWLAS